MKLGGSSRRRLARTLAPAPRVRRAQRRIADARDSLSDAVSRRDADSDATEAAPCREPRALCRSCGTTFETLTYSCSECDGATIEPVRADGGTDDVVENPPDRPRDPLYGPR